MFVCVERRLEVERIRHQLAETERQETLLKIVSKALTKNTAEMIKNEMREGLSKTVEETVRNVCRQDYLFFFL